MFVELLAGVRWVPIRYTLGVNQLLTRKSSTTEFNEPCFVSDALISGLQNCCYTNGALEPSPRLAIGTRIRIARGALVEYEGIIAAYSGAERVRLLLHMLGRDLEVTVKIEDVVETV